ncbi:MAG TPA: response regulator [Synergistaceae bacterium]|nr:response regulator [Synergistaceae bacterium]HQF92022.1 response regulator [Synergistaceae bacterium]HQH78758.1 response regulator [Synergistaceae bacterium]
MGVRVLVVEDDHISAMVIQEILLSVGSADVAENGLVAVDKFRDALERDEPYDCIFLDIMMPKMDGHETLEHIRGIEQEHGIWGLDAVKVVMITALGDFDNVKKSFRGQCDAYLVKPIRREKILSAVRDLGFDVP